LRSLANAGLSKTGKPDRLDRAARMAIDASFRDRGGPTTLARATFCKVDQLEELERISPQKERPPKASTRQGNAAFGRSLRVQARA
jgi:hypothetical protein